MRRTVSEAAVGDKMVRYRTRIDDDPSIKNSWEAKQKLFRLLQTVLDSPDLVSCGLAAPQQLRIYHSGESWIIEAESTVEV